MSEHISEPLATLRLFADDLRPDEITNLLGVDPDSFAARGEAFSIKHKRASLVEGPKNRPVIAKTGTWFISTKNKGIGLHPDKHLAWLLHIVEPVVEEMKQIYPSVKIEFSLLIHDQNFFRDRLLFNDIFLTTVSGALRLGSLDIEFPKEHLDLVFEQGLRQPAEIRERILAH